VAGRLKEGGEEVNALANDLRSQLARTDIDPDPRAALLSAFGSVAGRLKEGRPCVSWGSVVAMVDAGVRWARSPRSGRC
jgi:hypothetical protein